MTDQRVPPCSDRLCAREELVLKTYQYRFPFNYPNVKVDRRYHGGEFHGVELLLFPLLATSFGRRHIR
jgi:hypothetical protein